MGPRVPRSPHPDDGRPQVIFDDKLSTVWSAPNYCYRCGNLASILEVSETLERRFNMIDASEKSVLDDPTVPDVGRVRGAPCVLRAGRERARGLTRRPRAEWGRAANGLA